MKAAACLVISILPLLVAADAQTRSARPPPARDLIGQCIGNI